MKLYRFVAGSTSLRRLPSWLSKPLPIAALSVSVLLAGCDPAKGTTVPSIDAEGTIAGVVYLDRNANGQIEVGVDVPASGVGITLSPGLGLTPTGSEVVVAGTDGVLPHVDVAVGTYRIFVDPAALGDSLELAPTDSSRVTVTAGDTAEIAVLLRYPYMTMAELRAAPAARRITTDGIALNAWATFGDSTIHVQDSTGFIRMREVLPANVAIGDSLRIVATTGSRDGQPVLIRTSLFRLGAGTVRPAETVSATTARTARGGALDGALVAVTVTVDRDPVAIANGDTRVLVSDASGQLQVILDRDAQITSTLPIRVGGRLEVTGLLVPIEQTPGEWYLKPRTGADVRITYPLSTIAAARGMLSRFVRIRGVALNTGALDGLIYIGDSSASIRAQANAAGTIEVGDSVELQGEVRTLNDGQPALVGASIVLVNEGPPPVPVVITTARAATADGGALDAALVRISGTLADTAATFVRLNDGSGPVTVVRSFFPASLTAGQPFDITGVLIPATLNPPTWAVRPRTAADVR